MEDIITCILKQFYNEEPKRMHEFFENLKKNGKLVVHESDIKNN